MLERLFKLSENRTNVRTEIIAGVTTFLTMAYIMYGFERFLYLFSCSRYGLYMASGSSSSILLWCTFHYFEPI